MARRRPAGCLDRAACALSCKGGLCPAVNLGQVFGRMVRSAFHAPCRVQGVRGHVRIGGVFAILPPVWWVGAPLGHRHEVRERQGGRGGITLSRGCTAGAGPFRAAAPWRLGGPACEAPRIGCPRTGSGAGRGQGKPGHDQRCAVASAGPNPARCEPAKAAGPANVRQSALAAACFGSVCVSDYPCPGVADSDLCVSDGSTDAAPPPRGR